MGLAVRIFYGLGNSPCCSRHRSMPTMVRTKSVCVLAAFWAIFLTGDLQARPPRADDEAVNTLSKSEQADGWKLLFDGKSTEGWRKYKGKSVPDSWKAVDGVLVYQPGTVRSHGGDIVTQDPYQNFELALEWKISEGGNSGIM